MNEEKKTQKDNTREDEIDLRQLFSIFLKRKWWFIGTFVIVLIAGLLFTFVRTPEYSSISTIKVSADYAIESLMNYFPELTSRLNVGTVNNAAIELGSSIIRDQVIKNIKYGINKSELDKAINIFVDEKNQIVSITAKHSDPVVSYNINKLLIETYQGEKTQELTETYQELLKRVEERIANTNQEVERLTVDVEKNLLDINLKILEQLENKKSSNESSNVYFTGINYVSPVLLNELNSKLVELNELKKINKILLENEKIFINKIEIVTYPDIPIKPNEANHKRNIVFSLFLAIIMGLAVVFVANYFITSRKK
jgi:uncharacterized protein involved in exopolysaccharide biosynthesis